MDDTSTPTRPLLSRVLIVDDDPAVRRVCDLALSAGAVECAEATTGPDAVSRLVAGGYDLALLDMDLPGFGGEQVLRRVRAEAPDPYLKVILFSGRAAGDDLARLLAAGADDFVNKPFSVAQLRARVAAALRLRAAQVHAADLSARLATANATLDQGLMARDAELVHARGALVLALARLVGQKSAETGAHLTRLQRYCRVLATAAADRPGYRDRLSPDVAEAVAAAAPLHDIGKVAVPDAVLNKPGPLTPAERAVMQLHTTAGADTLAGVAAEHPFALSFFGTAVEIARGHHEKWDGTGYPDRLAGEAIPLSARVVAVADVYDALRGRRVYKPSVPHAEAVAVMTAGSPGHFDPGLVAVFREVAAEFEAIYGEMAD